MNLTELNITLEGYAFLSVCEPCSAIGGGDEDAYGLTTAGPGASECDGEWEEPILILISVS